MTNNWMVVPGEGEEIIEEDFWGFQIEWGGNEAIKRNNKHRRQEFGCVLSILSFEMLKEWVVWAASL